MEKLIEHIKSTMHYTVIYNGVEYLTNDTVVVRIGATDKPDSADFDNRLVGIKSEELFSIGYEQAVVSQILTHWADVTAVIMLNNKEVYHIMEEYAQFIEKGATVGIARNRHTGGYSLKIKDNILISATDV